MAGDDRAVLDARPRLTRLLAEVAQRDLPGAAATHRVSGCAHHALAACAGLDPDVAAELAQARQAALTRHLSAARALAPIGAALEGAGIAWLVVKGPALAHAYGQPGLRTYADLDILVPRSQFPAAMQALEPIGFDCTMRNWALVRAVGPGELPLSDGVESIDLHWHVLHLATDRDRFDLDVGPWIERRRPVNIGGRQIPTLDPVDTVLHLAIHMMRSGADRLVWLKDLQVSLAADGFDAYELVTRARAARVDLVVSVALQRARQTLGTETTPAQAALDGTWWLALDRAATRLVPVETARGGGSPARLLARATSASQRASLTQAVRATASWGREVLANANRARSLGQDPHSSQLETGTEADRSDYLAWVEQG